MASQNDVSYFMVTVNTRFEGSLKPKAQLREERAKFRAVPGVSRGMRCFAFRDGNLPEKAKAGKEAHAFAREWQEKLGILLRVDEAWFV